MRANLGTRFWVAQHRGSRRARLWPAGVEPIQRCDKKGRKNNSTLPKAVAPRRHAPSREKRPRWQAIRKIPTRALNKKSRGSPCPIIPPSPLMPQILAEHRPPGNAGPSTPAYSQRRGTYIPHSLTAEGWRLIADGSNCDRSHRQTQATCATIDFGSQGRSVAAGSKARATTNDQRPMIDDQLWVWVGERRRTHGVRRFLP